MLSSSIRSALKRMTEDFTFTTSLIVDWGSQCCIFFTQRRPLLVRFFMVLDTATFHFSHYNVLPKPGFVSCSTAKAHCPHQVHLFSGTTMAGSNRWMVGLSSRLRNKVDSLAHILIMFKLLYFLRNMDNIQLFVESLVNIKRMKNK